MSWSLKFALIATLALSTNLECPAEDKGEIAGDFDTEKLLVVPAKLGDQAVRCIVDTGSTHLAFDTVLKPYLGECSPYDPRGIEVCRPKRFSIRGFRESDIGIAAVVDLEPFRIASGIDFNVILGMPSLKGKTIEIGREGTYRLYSGLALGVPGTVPLRPDAHGRPWVSLSIGDRTVSALLDTGCNGEIDLETRIFDQVIDDLDVGNDVTTTESETVYGRQSDRACEGVDVRIGRETLEDCSINESDINKIGFGILLRTGATIDLKAMRLELADPAKKQAVASGRPSSSEAIVK